MGSSAESGSLSGSGRARPLVRHERASYKLRFRPLRAVTRLGSKAEQRRDYFRGNNGISQTAIHSRSPLRGDHDLVATGFQLGSHDKPPPSRISVVARERNQVRELICET